MSNQPQEKNIVSNPSAKKAIDYGLSTPERFVQKKKKKRIALVLFSVGFLGCSMLAILAYLGRTSGDFTIQLGEGKTLLTMATDTGFSDSTSFLKAKGLERSVTWSADLLPQDSELDSSTGGSKNGSYSTSMTTTLDSYLAYTFFVRNDSTDSVDYLVNLSIDNYVNPVNESSSLLDILRVRLFENSVYNGSDLTHNMATYAMKSNSPYTLPDGSEEARECIGKCIVHSDGSKDYSVATKPENRGFASAFVDNSNVFNTVHENLKVSGIVRYTIVMWLEGDDPDCTGQAPKNAYITFSMHFDVLTGSKT